MLQGKGRTTLLMRFGSRVCVCMRRRQLNAVLIDLIRPAMLGPYACWCDKVEPQPGTSQQSTINAPNLHPSDRQPTARQEPVTLQRR